MPNPQFAPLKSGSFAILIALLAVPGFGQSPHKPEAATGFMQFMLPWEGPGAAVFNPALAAETRHADARYGYMSAVSGKGFHDFLQGTVMSPWNVAVGFAMSSNSSTIDGANAVYEEGTRRFMIAWSDTNVSGRGFGLGAGLARITHDLNAFDAVHSELNAYDAGFQAVTPALGRAGLLHAGFTLRNLAADKLRLPDGGSDPALSEYKVLFRSYDVSFLLKSALECLDLYSEFNLYQDHDPGGGALETPLVKSLGFEYRPIPFLGLKVEKIWTQRWTAGLAIRAPLAVPVFDGIRLGAEANLSHDKILTEKDEGRGLIASLMLGIAL